MTHAERIREAERAVVEDAVEVRLRALCSEDGWEDAGTLYEKVDALLALRAAACPECEGYGVKARIVQRAPDWEEQRVILPCPAGCEAGKRRDA